MRLIDADALYRNCKEDLMSRFARNENLSPIVCAALDFFMGKIKKCPTIDPEELRPKGRWVDKMVRDWHCSECGKKVPRQVHFDGYCYEDKLNYCPNCGAKMEDKPPAAHKTEKQEEL